MAQQRMNVQAPVERLLAERWSTRAFDGEKQLSAAVIASCLEAARWAPSCYGEQPWHYIVADRFQDQTTWDAVLAALAPTNQLWAAHAPVLIVAVAQPLFSHNAQPNRWAAYDTGQATICLCLQAAALGLATHQMGGFDAERLSAQLALPDDLMVMSVTALAYPGDAAVLAEAFQAGEAEGRSRKPLSEIAHAGVWGQSWQPPAASGWEARYQETAVHQLPWFCSGLDPDFAQAVTASGIEQGSVLDIGCGPGTQAVALAQQGFTVTACDVSASAVVAARRLAALESVDIDFYVDDLLNSKLSTAFELILDRGVFHCFAEPADQQRYLATVAGLLLPGGLLLLKCFHRDETRQQGPPGRYGAGDIRTFFHDHFELLEACDTLFSAGAEDDAPKALFCLLKKRSGAAD